jgi:hypothetical protein
VLAAIFGLIGVLVGAGVTGGVDVLLARRHDEADRRQAKRMVATEIHTLWVHLSLLVGTKQIPRLRGEELERRFLPVEVWNTHRASLARAITDDEDWQELFVFYDNVTLTRWLIAEKEPLEVLPPDEVKETEDMQRTAAKLYERLAGRPPTHD